MHSIKMTILLVQLSGVTFAVHATITSIPLQKFLLIT